MTAKVMLTMTCLRTCWAGNRLIITYAALKPCCNTYVNYLNNARYLIITFIMNFSARQIVWQPEIKRACGQQALSFTSHNKTISLTSASHQHYSIQQHTNPALKLTQPHELALPIPDCHQHPAELWLQWHWRQPMGYNPS